MRWTQTLTFSIAVLLLTACGPQSTAVKPPLPTTTPAPTFTATPVDPAAADTSGQANAQTQEQPTATPAAPTDTPTDTPTPQAPTVTINTNMNVRGGPGTNYSILGTASPGQQFPITGKNPAGNWWQIDYNGRAGWVFGQLVTAAHAEGMQVATNIPAPPPTPTPPPTPRPAPTLRPAPQFPYSISHQGKCEKNERVTYFEGIIRDRTNTPRNDVCVLLFFHEPRNIKCSGCPSIGGQDGKGGQHGTWGFNPFPQAKENKSLHDQVRGLPIEIYVVACPQALQPGVRPDTVSAWKARGGEDWPNLTPLSEKWTRTLPESQACTKITFKEN